MTVKELIEELKKVDPNLPVVAPSEHTYTYSYARSPLVLENVQVTNYDCGTHFYTVPKAVAIIE